MSKAIERVKHAYDKVRQAEELKSFIDKLTYHRASEIKVICGLDSYGSKHTNSIDNTSNVNYLIEAIIKAIKQRHDLLMDEIESEFNEKDI